MVELKRLEPGGVGDVEKFQCPIKNGFFSNKFGVELWVFVPFFFRHIASME